MTASNTHDVQTKDLTDDESAQETAAENSYEQSGSEGTCNSLNVHVNTSGTNKDEDDTPVVVEDDMKVPDGGWGWFIVLGAVLLRCIVGGLVRSRGILFIKFKDRFHSTAASTALLTSLSACLRLILGPMVSILTNSFACRKLVMFGVLFFSASHIASAYTPNQGFLYFSFSVLGGFGRAFVLTPIPLLLGSYFDKRRSLAFGLASSGFSIGGFTLTPVVEVLFQTYGFQGAFLLLGGFVLQILVFATLFRPIELHRKLTAKRKRNGEATMEVLLKSQESFRSEEEINSTVITVASGDVSKTNSKASNKTHSTEVAGEVVESGDVPKTNSKAGNKTHSTGVVAENDDQKSLLTDAPTQNGAGGNKRRKSSSAKTDVKPAKKKLIDLTILKDVRYLCYVFATMCFTLPSPGLFLPSLAKERGLTDIQAAALLSVTAGFDAAFRVFSGFVLDLKMFRDLRPEIFNGMTFGLCVTIALFPSMDTFAHFAVLCAVQGSFVGMKNAQGSVVVMDMLGVDKLASSLAVTMAAQGVTIFIGPTIAGQLTDMYGTYDGAYYFGACAMFVGACIMAFGQIWKRVADNKSKKKRNGDKARTEEEDVDPVSRDTLHKDLTP